ASPAPAPSAGPPEPAPAPTPAPAPAPDATTATATASSLTGYAAEVAQAYAFPGGTLPLGALLVDGEPEPRSQVAFSLGMLNRHGLVAGATGTGKTRTLQAMAEGLSDAGVPVFLADVKGDLSGLLTPGTPSEKLLARTESLGQDWSATTYPVELLTLGGLGTGTPVRTTVTDFGPLLLSRVLGLNETQESSLGLIVHWADQQGLALLDLKDLQSTIAYLTSDDGKAELKGIGGVSSATAGVILREIVALQAQGADAFFGEPAFGVHELLRTAPDGRGVITALELPAVADRPALFSTFLMWLLAELYSELPEVGDQDRPRLVFFFDEAHLLFTGASKDFLTQVVQTVRLIRSKGVGVFFVTQSPQDVPADVLAQLGNRVQHALRAFTPQDASALRAAVRTYPKSPYDLEQLLTALGTGECVVTVMSERGAPTPVAWTRVRAPQSSMDPAPATALEAAVAGSPLAARYGTRVDNASAYELLAERVEHQSRERLAEEQRAAAEKAAASEAAAREKELAKMQRDLEKQSARARGSSGRSSGSSGSGRSSSRSASHASPLDNFLRSAGTQLGREITRTIFGTRRR
ncbi:helicase HerA-like domain-containing protein, partial [Miniimonas arenae]|uniref:helicase HerA-like domain-containing protein n=1 Tax=Miniimonas arenae TaxID=676201 RepID=UPI0028ACFD88